MDQLERIKYMEQALDDSLQAVAALESALDQYRAIIGRYRELIRYYEGGLWLRDFEDDCAGKLPADLKRGVLSEDGVYNLLSDHDRILAGLRQLLPEENQP